MVPSKNIEEFIRGYEKCVLHAFLPTPNDVWTIAWGHTEGVKKGDQWTQAKADEVFAADLAGFSARVSALIGTAPTTQNQFDALVSFAYNEGPEALHTSTLLRKHRSKDYAGAADEFKNWNKQRNKKTGNLEVLDGLTKRRAAEAAIYRKG